MNLPACGRAAGKVILLGEHAVVYGRPALAAGLPLDLRAEVVAAPGPARCEPADARADRLIAEAAAALGVTPEGFVVRVRSDVPAGVGLGSSAALAIAVVRALGAAAGRAPSAAEELVLGRRLEAIFHGQSSGIDPAAAALGTCLRFVRGEPPVITPLRPGVALPLVIAFGDRPRSTGAAVGGLRTRWEAEPACYEQLFDEVAAVVDEGAGAAERGDLAALGRALDQNQALLERLGVSAPEVEALVAAARSAGALGAKLTGGGAGGAIIALAPETGRVASALAARGVRTLVVSIGAAEEAAA